MNLRKINVKFYLEEGQEIPLKKFIPLFHTFIQENLLEGLLIDVTEYTHVFQGPGVILIAHEANYGLDETDGRRGLLYNQKRIANDGLESVFKTALRRALTACELLEKRGPGRIRFAKDRFQIFINDRLGFPDDTQARERVERTIRDCLAPFCGGDGLYLEDQSHPSRRLEWFVRVKRPLSIQGMSGF